RPRDGASAPTRAAAAGSSPGRAFTVPRRWEARRTGARVVVRAPGRGAPPIRDHVLGPDGTPWEEPPVPAFRIWPVAKCVDSIIRLIVKRRKQALLPWFVGPLLNLDRVLGSWIGDRVLTRCVPPLPGPTKATQRE